MRNFLQKILIPFFLLYLFFAYDADAKTISAASCSKADVTTAYNSASSGDTVLVPAGDCSWTSTLPITKNIIRIQGAGINQTYIRLGSNYTPAFLIQANNVRITGFTFDGQFKSTSNSGGIVVGFLSDTCNSNTYHLGDFRIDHNRFIQFDNVGANGNNAISSFGFTYGIIDSNTFDNCTGECLNVCSDGVPNGILRSQEFGQYTNGTIYIEDNTWNYTQSYTAENMIDGNSASRYVLRHNTINVTGTGGVNGFISNHETCATCSCDAATTGDAGSLVMEIYGNSIYCGSSCPYFVTERSGRVLIYNNTFYTTDTGFLVRLSNYRSFDYANCDSAAHARGYSEWCHDADTSYATEGRIFSKTTLDNTLGNDTGCPTVSSLTDFPIYGGSIIVGTEQIDYTGISNRTLTPCVRGANVTTRTTHSSGSNVDLLMFGVCKEQINNTYIWNNKTSGGADKNDVLIYTNGPVVGHSDYSTYDIQSYTKRPQNWQYRNDGIAFSYTPYPYPHPLRAGDPTPSAPQNLHIH